jgi:hypothetical protein
MVNIDPPPPIKPNVMPITNAAINPTISMLFIMDCKVAEIKWVSGQFFRDILNDKNH